jgi:hypothetical protein
VHRFKLASFILKAAVKRLAAVCERSKHQNEPFALSVIEAGTYRKHLMQYFADKMYVYFNKESGENRERERDPLTQQVIGCAMEAA